jgi:hypothetical protein
MISARGAPERLAVVRDCFNRRQAEELDHGLPVPGEESDRFTSAQKVLQ